MIEETILNVNQAKENEKKEQNVQNIQGATKNIKKKGKSWAAVTLGGVSGILLGAGSAAGAHAYTNAQDAKTEDGGQQTTDNAQQTTETPHATTVNDDQAFAEAFEAARAELGPHSSFEWHGRVYSTDTVDEWNSQTPEQQQHVIENSGVTTPGDELVNGPEEGQSTEPQSPSDPPIDNSGVETEPETLAGGGSTQGQEGTDGSNGGDDVSIVGVYEEDGHIATQVDLNGDGESDITIVDVDDNGELSDPDVMIDNDGNSITYAEYANGTAGSQEGGEPTTYYTGNEEEVEPDPTELINEEPGVDFIVEDTSGNVDDIITEDQSNDVSYLENPDVAEDMPDYMNDVIV